jgi:hypothetical protein
VVVPFLQDDEVQKLRDAFMMEKGNAVTGFYATAHAEDTAFRRRMSETVRAVFQRAFELYFDRCEALGGSFIVKAPHGKEILQPHQDWNIVDETKYRSFNVWVPLVDLTPENGTILVMPGSHQWHRGFRHSSIPCAYGPIHSLLIKHMEPLYLKAGEALIYDHALLHASEANRSDTPRMACACGVIPTEADMRFYWNENGTVEEYAGSPQFFMEHNVFTGPHGLLKLRDIPYDFPSFQEDDFYRFSSLPKPVSKPENAPPQKSFWQVYTPLNIFREIKYRLSGK